MQEFSEFIISYKGNIIQDDCFLMLNFQSIIVLRAVVRHSL